MLPHWQEKVATPRKFKFLPIHNPFELLTGPCIRSLCDHAPACMSTLPIMVKHKVVPHASAREDLVTFMVSANSDVCKSGQPNFKGCRIPVPAILILSTLNETTVSPLNTVPKKDSAEHWVVDLSFPKHSPDRSINGGITKDAYLGDHI